MDKFVRLLAILSLTAFAVSCATVASVTGKGAQLAGNLGLIDNTTAQAVVKSTDSIGKALEDITPEQEYYIGRAVGANILITYKIYNGNPALTAYVNEICKTITINSPRPEIYNGYHVAILDTDQINAFATSGGHIFITRGLIDSTGSEDALAAVVAHEVAHILLQHGLKAIKTGRITQALVATGSAAASVATSGTDLGELTDIFDESVNEIVTTMVNKGYSQSQEFDADNTALSLMASAGYDPASLLDMLKALEKSQAAHSGGFNSTHPSPAKRLAAAEKNAGSYKVTDTRSYRVKRFKAVM